MEDVTNGLKITIVIGITLIIISLIGAIAIAGTVANNRHNQIVRACIQNEGQWINGSCIRSTLLRE